MYVLYCLINPFATDDTPMCGWRSLCKNDQGTGSSNIENIPVVISRSWKINCMNVSIIISRQEMVHSNTKVNKARYLK